MKSVYSNVKWVQDALKANRHTLTLHSFIINPHRHTLTGPINPSSKHTYTYFLSFTHMHTHTCTEAPAAMLSHSAITCLCYSPLTQSDSVIAGLLLKT